MSDMRNDFEEMIRQEVESDREYKIALRRVAGDYAHNGMQQRFEDFCCGVESTESRITQLETELAAALASQSQQEPYAYDVPTEDGTELAYAIYFTKYHNPLPEGAIPLYAIPDGEKE